MYDARTVDPLTMAQFNQVEVINLCVVPRDSFGSKLCVCDVDIVICHTFPNDLPRKVVINGQIESRLSSSTKKVHMNAVK